MNKIILIGNLCRDPEHGETTNGIPWAKFSLAVNRDSESTDYFVCVAWKNNAENVAKYLKKGNKAAVMGRLLTRDYETEEGEKRRVYEISADTVEFLTPKAEKEDEKKVITDKKKAIIKAKKKAETEEFDDYLPF